MKRIIHKFYKVPEHTWQIGLARDFHEKEKYFYVALGWWIWEIELRLEGSLRGWFFYTAPRKEK